MNVCLIGTSPQRVHSASERSERGAPPRSQAFWMNWLVTALENLLSVALRDLRWHGTVCMTLYVPQATHVGTGQHKPAKAVAKAGTILDTSTGNVKRKLTVHLSFCNHSITESVQSMAIRAYRTPNSWLQTLISSPDNGQHKPTHATRAMPVVSSHVKPLMNSHADGLTHVNTSHQATSTHDIYACLIQEVLQAWHQK